MLHAVSALPSQMLSQGMLQAKLLLPRFSVASKKLNLILRGGTLDGFEAVVIDNLAAIDHFESLLCTSRSAIANAFRSLDLDESGHISRNELRDALKILGVTATEKEVDAIFNGLDENKDDGINFEVSRPPFQTVPALRQSRDQLVRAPNGLE